MRNYFHFNSLIINFFRQWKEDSLAKINEEKFKLKKVRQFLKKEKEAILKKRQELEKAREEWRMDVKIHGNDEILQQVKIILEKQAKKLNEESHLLNGIQRFFIQQLFRNTNFQL